MRITPFTPAWRWRRSFNAREPRRFHFHFLTGEPGLSPHARTLTDQIVRTRGAASHYVRLDPGVTRQFPRSIPGYLTPGAFNRLLIPTVLRDLDRCIYLDCDVVALGDLAELWDQDIFGPAVAVVRDCFIDREGLNRFPEVRTYFNSGVMGMNLRRWRGKNYTTECLKLCADPRMTERFADQDLLNVVFATDLHLLHARWNIQTGQRPWYRSPRLVDDLREWRECQRSPGLAHYCGPRKPSHWNMRHDWSMEYWRVLANSPWAWESPRFKQQQRRAGLSRCKAVASRLLRQSFNIGWSRRRKRFSLILLGRLIVDRKW